VDATVAEAAAVNRRRRQNLRDMNQTLVTAPVSMQRL
jgi:hypothetical protein